ncbi:hypothetical protein [Trinickia sp. LjRoot230]|uniref:hypothetical protein n=1 Tax=Trinickia sp. LjRoot230 TaxID=3342288 RepID=UPI003F5017E0
MGLASLSSVSLAEARAEAGRCRKLLSEGVDPIDALRADRDRAVLAASSGMRFNEAAAELNLSPATRAIGRARNTRRMHGMPFNPAIQGRRQNNGHIKVSSRSPMTAPIIMLRYGKRALPGRGGDDEMLLPSIHLTRSVSC